MARKEERLKMRAFWERLVVVLSRPWALFERSAVWNMLLDHYCVNDFERNHCAGIARPSSEAVSIYRFEFVFFTLLLVLVLQPGVLSTWVSIPLLFLTRQSRGIRSAIKTHLVGYEWRLIQVVKSSGFSRLVARSTMGSRF